MLTVGLTAGTALADRGASYVTSAWECTPTPLEDNHITAQEDINVVLKDAPAAIADMYWRLYDKGDMVMWGTFDVLCTDGRLTLASLNPGGTADDATGGDTDLTGADLAAGGKESYTLKVYNGGTFGHDSFQVLP